MTDCTIGHRAVRHQGERRRARIISVIGAIAIVIGAIIWGHHPPDPSSCKPDLSRVVTQTASPISVGLGCFDPSQRNNAKALFDSRSFR
jgi:hypothetical protein